MKQIYTTTLRLNLADEDDRRAYEHLQRMEKSNIALTARRLLPPSTTILNGRHGLLPTPIWKPVKKRMLFSDG